MEESSARRRALMALSQVENASLAERTENNGRLVHTLVSRTIRFHDRDDERRVQLKSGTGRRTEQILTRCCGYTNP